MSEQRRGYRYNHVLIESDRILSPQFDDAVVFLSGAQIELLRNVTQYLRQIDTYVSSYHQDYYLTPDASDYDDILAIVADLEETLMGNPNVIWGYSGLYNSWDSWDGPPAGFVGLTTDDVAEGKILRLEGVAFLNEDTVMTRLLISIRQSGRIFPMVDIANPPANVWQSYSFDRTLDAGMDVTFDCWGVVANDALTWAAWGREMDVPV